MKCYRFLGQEGRTTIPLPIREYLELEDHDLISFTVEDDSVVIRREDICCDCIEEEPETVEDFFDRMTLEQQQALVSHLAQRLLRRKGGLRHGRA